MSELAYSLHLGSDKNKKGSARQSAKINKSRTTSLSNNAIQNAKDLSKVANHNYRKYDNKQHLIEIVRGTSFPDRDVKKIYKEEFEEARVEYNAKQIREDRKINDYFKRVSANSKSDLACEIIIELGDKSFWDTKDMDYKRNMTNVFKKQVEDLEMLIPEFKVASAIIHYDETSPHLHIVGVPIKYNCKTGMSKQVGKGAVFTKESLSKLQDKMRVLCIEIFNKEYKEKNKLKGKLKGRNIDYAVSEMSNYAEKIKQVDKQREKLEKANKKSLNLDKNSKDLRHTILNLKSTLTSKDKYILKEREKQNILVYIENVSNTNDEYKELQKLSVDLQGLNESIKQNKEELQELKENNEALTLRVSYLNKAIKEKEENIKDLKEENRILNNLVNYFEDKFNKLKNFLRDKVFSHNKKEADKYDEIVDDMYNKNVLDNEDTESIYNEKYYDYNKNDDFDLRL